MSTIHFCCWSGLSSVNCQKISDSSHVCNPSSECILTPHQPLQHLLINYPPASLQHHIFLFNLEISPIWTCWLQPSLCLQSSIRKLYKVLITDCYTCCSVCMSVHKLHVKWPWMWEWMLFWWHGRHGYCLLTNAVGEIWARVPITKNRKGMAAAITGCSE